ncbi:MAG: 3-phosphoshikimate 1-carboxyvinyltransferase, partial [Hungatella sp.]
MKFTRATGLKGEINIPGDKSISHRSVMFGSIAKGTTEISNYLNGADCLSTISCFQRMGIDITHTGHKILVHGLGLHGLKAPREVLDCGNSGTTMRLLSGILAAQSFDVTLTGDDSIKKRPMKRIMEPLTLMGAQITGLEDVGCAPLAISGRPLHGIHYPSQVASAQVKSAILLAGLYASGETKVTEPYISRDHTEIMLRCFGAEVKTEGTTAIIRPVKELYGTQVQVPGDISSAAFFIAAGLLVPNSEILIRHVGLNPTRDGMLQVCKDMGADITYLHEHSAFGEPTADLLVRSGSLHGMTIGGA